MVNKYLIVNADDYNTDKERNRGIMQAAMEGIVTSVSVIANLPFESEEVLNLQNVFGANIGIHLNLTKGRPLTAEAKTLIGNNGHFFEKRKAWQQALFRRYDLKEVEGEFAAQINHLKAAGVTPDHIDGNNHIHVFPGIAEVVGQLANDFGISKIRLSLEAFNSWNNYCSPGAIRKSFIGTLSKRARMVFNNYGLRFPDHFAGIQFPRVSDVSSLRAFIRNFPEGTTELMCHPGYRNERENRYSTGEREQELLALTDSGVLKDIRCFNITLISFSGF